MTDFLPKDYDIPSTTSGNYFKPQSGDNRLRILDSPIMGGLYWVNAEGEIKSKDEPPAKGDKPVRLRMGTKVPDEAKPTAKHFWALPIFNYATESIEIWEITQSTIQGALKELAQDEDWGNPRDYDVNVTRQGEKLQTEYSVIPKPKSVLKTEPAAEWAKIKTKLNLDTLYSGGNPFEALEANSTVKSPQEETNSLDEIGF